MTPDALVTFVALLFAHLLADFILQTGWIVANKRKPGVLLLHGALVLLAAQVTVGSLSPILIALAAAHVAIDAAKIYGQFNRFSGFAIDQIAHLGTLVLVAGIAPSLFVEGIWADIPHTPTLFLVGAAFIAAVAMGEHGIALLMRPYGARVRSRGLPQAGRLIGRLERAVVVLLVLAQMPLGIGFLLTAKSILRFGTASRDQQSAEYVIIGTLASFSWALAVGLATVHGMTLLETGATNP
ncbi:Protein of unknown function [Poseidonocella pacifica]|uniref:DUF3307 domain-containing protein n=1 Tax=Poseidonocella pacifica TaxID=871651 RepID=A0A1I0XDH9_9RHOB|nr:DUF3307 domain-containing protein [Poseidonocella pacifica]SFA98757.1 Protein of unknown function [Poseidonocella pacifica]